RGCFLSGGVEDSDPLHLAQVAGGSEGTLSAAYGIDGEDGPGIRPIRDGADKNRTVLAHLDAVGAAEWPERGDRGLCERLGIDPEEAAGDVVGWASCIRHDNIPARVQRDVDGMVEQPALANDYLGPSVQVDLPELAGGTARKAAWFI